MGDKLKNLENIWELFKKSQYFDKRSTVNPVSLSPQEGGQILEEKGIFTFVRKEWKEKDGSEVRLIDFVFDPNNFSCKDIKKLAQEFINLKGSSRNLFIGVNVDSRLEDYLNCLLGTGFEEVIRLSEMELLLEKPFKLDEEFDYEIRKPKENELRDVYEMVFKTQVKGTIGQTNPSDEDYQDFLEKELEDIDLCTFIWNGDKIIAQITAIKIDDYVEIKELAVLPEYWRKGIATYMAKLTFNKALESGVNRIRLHTDSYNRYGALSLYKKLGFEVLYESVRLRLKLS